MRRTLLVDSVVWGRGRSMALAIHGQLLVVFLASILMLFGSQSMAQVTGATASTQASKTPPEVTAPGKEQGSPKEAMECMEHGKKFLQDGLYLEAADLFETVLTYRQAGQLWPEATMLAAKAYLTASRAISSTELRNKSLALFQQFSQSYKDSPLMEEVTWLWALALFEAGDYFEAEPRFTELLNRFPKRSFAAEAEYHLGRILEASQKYLDAQKRYYRVIEYYGRPAEYVEDSTFRLAKITTMLEKYELAAQWYVLACNLNPKRCLMDSDVLFYRGVAHGAIAEYKEAVKYLQRFVNIFPDDPRYEDAMLALAQNLETIGDFAGAGAVLGLVSESAKPEARVEGLLRLADMEAKSGRKLTQEGYLAMYKRIVHEAPYTDQAMSASLRISKDCLQRQDFGGALEYVDWFFASYDESKFTDEAFDLRESAVLGLLQTHLSQGEHFDAAVTFERRLNQLRKQSSLSQARFLAAQAYFGLMGYTKSASLLAAVEDKFLTAEERRQKRLLLALRSYFEGKDKEAASALESLSQDKQDNVSLTAIYRLIDLLIRQSKVKEALQQYAQLPPDYSDTRFLLSIDFRAGLLLSGSKEHALAKQAFDRYIQLNLKRRKLTQSGSESGPAEAVTSGPSKTTGPLDCDSHLATSAFLEKAKCAIALGQSQEAAEVLDSVITGCEDSPFVYEACCLLADLKVQAGKSDEAIESLKRCGAIDKKEPVWKEAQSLLLAEIEVRRRLDEIASWWVEE